jgi:hypothetical protein
MMHIHTLLTDRGEAPTTGEHAEPIWRRSRLAGMTVRAAPERAICVPGWSPARTRPRIGAWPPGLAGHDGPRFRRWQRSGRVRCWEDQVEGQAEDFADTERQALGVGSLQLLFAQVFARLVEAVLAAARLEFCHGLPVRSRKASAAPCRAAARSQSPASPARQARPRMAKAMPMLLPFRRLSRRAAWKVDRAPSG